MHVVEKADAPHPPLAVLGAQAGVGEMQIHRSQRVRLEERVYELYPRLYEHDVVQREGPGPLDRHVQRLERDVYPHEAHIRRSRRKSAQMLPGAAAYLE